MKHLNQLTNVAVLPHDFITRATGKYYTHQNIADHLIHSLLANIKNADISAGNELRVVDPFAGDGRLVYWLIGSWISSDLPSVKWRITLWDINEEGLNNASSSLISEFDDKVDIKVEWKKCDSFIEALDYRDNFDVVITNPPWELLKPDSRELKSFPLEVREKYIDEMREYDQFLAKCYPKSQPLKKFAGWGTNLSRVGLELSQFICKPDGLLGVILPASFLADDQSSVLRREMLERNNLKDVSYIPAEAKLFGKADVDTITAIFEMGKMNGVKPMLTLYDKTLSVKNSTCIKIPKAYLKETNYVLPISVGFPVISILKKFTKRFSTWAELEENKEDGLWAGREVDETGSKKWLEDSGDGPLFVKGRMIQRFFISEAPSQHIEKKGWTKPISSEFERIVWRDVSRANQKRRVIATIIPNGYVSGNSLGVAYFRDDDKKALHSLLGIMSSLCFELQLRCTLATGHISLSALRKVRVPSKNDLITFKDLIKAVNSALSGNERAESRIEAIVAKHVYGLERNEFELIMDVFTKLTKKEKSDYLKEFDKLGNKKSVKMVKHALEAFGDNSQITIPNHHSSRLSELDMMIVKSVPPGGNWKNIPESIPSKRLEQIRESYAQGKGSRSTYYGRLKPNMPSYTINTYFNRPGNGCHIHYEQDRVLSQREAARLQSFPDGFVFSGSQTSINTQIGNAVPPLLAFQIANRITPKFKKAGCFIDLFSGAGGLGLGFAWAGWKPIVSNDIEKRFLETYSQNVHEKVVCGSITDNEIFSKLVEIASDFRKKNKNVPLIVLGGPPCQGFSTAGHKRTMEDERNQLFWDYKNFLDKVRPDGFVFENVTGLLNMQKGKVFAEVKEVFRSVMPSVNGWVLSADNYAVPQRRKRVILAGFAKEGIEVGPPEPITSCDDKTNLFDPLKQTFSVQEALSDLPSLSQGENGSHKSYKSKPKNIYQEFMRGLITPSEYLKRVVSD